MRTPSALCAIALICAGLAACGSSSSGHSGSSTTTSSGSSKTPARAVANENILEVGRPATASDRRAITALLKRYYTAADTGNGAKACTMLYITFAEAIPEDYGKPPGQPYMYGKTCPAVMIGVFKHFHKQIVTDNASLKVTRVLLQEHHGVALLHFKGMPEQEIPVQRERHTWKIDSLLANPVS